MIRIAELMHRVVAWFAGFFEEGTTGRPSSKRLQAIAAQFVALGVICALAGAAVGIAYAMKTDPVRAERALGMLLGTVEVLAGMTLLGGGVAYLGGKGIERGAGKLREPTE